jgi:tetratricopeptide (TPR) repeat protein
MITSVLLSGALMLGVLTGDGADARPSDLAAYKSAAAGAGHDPSTHVRLALWCEEHGLTAERLKHLSIAVLYDPTNALARGLLGLVAYRGKWAPPDQVTQAVQSDLERKARVREYLERRAKAPDRAEDQWKLALWCEQNDLKQQATAHLFRVLQLDPSRDAAWRHLGYKRISGRWDKPERVAAAKSEAHEQHKADKHWRPLLERWREALASREKNKREQAEKSLAEVTDPRAVPMVWVVFANGGVSQQKTAVKALGQIDSPGSSRALALLAIKSRSGEIGREATQVLRRRDPRDFAGVLIALLREPIKYEVRRVNGPGSQGQLLVKGKDANVKRLYSPPAAPNVPLMPGDQVFLDGDGLPVVLREMGQFQMPGISTGNTPDAALPALFGLGNSPAQISGALTRAGVPAGLSQRLGANMASNITVPVFDLTQGIRGDRTASERVNREVGIPVGQMALDAQRSAQVAQQQLATDVQAIDNYNAPIVDMNQQVRQVLTDSVGVDQGPSVADWQKWLVDLSGYAFSAQSSYDPPTVEEQVPIAYQPQAAPLIVDQPVAIVVRHSCFGAGTLVRTLDGSSPIEKLRAGDLVLTEDPKTGELKYQPVVTAYHNPPNATLRIELGNETIVATGIHRFWKAGRGWIMARELKPGDTLRTLGGLAVVKSVEKEQVQPVFNLQVADGESFFVGQAGILAHDNSVVNPTPSPFDAVPELAKSAAQRTAANHDGP